jgi:hypothetical protein
VATTLQEAEEVGNTSDVDMEQQLLGESVGCDSLTDVRLPDVLLLDVALPDDSPPGFPLPDDPLPDIRLPDDPLHDVPLPDDPLPDVPLPMSISLMTLSQRCPWMARKARSEPVLAMRLG